MEELRLVFHAVISRRIRISLFVAVCIFICGCTRSVHSVAVDSAQAMPPKATEYFPEAVMDDAQYCFNGRFIVSSDGFYGIAGEDAAVILPSEYDEIEFLSDDIALAGQGRTFMLCDRNGRIIHKSPDKEWLIANNSVLYDNLLEEDRLYWDKAIEMLSDLSRRCQSVRSGKISRGELEALRIVKGDIESYLSEAQGTPTPEQIRRITDIELQYPGGAK